MRRCSAPLDNTGPSQAISITGEVVKRNERWIVVLIDIDYVQQICNASLEEFTHQVPTNIYCAIARLLYLRGTTRLFVDSF